jgi:hypothetical protein
VCESLSIAYKAFDRGCHILREECNLFQKKFQEKYLDVWEMESNEE